MRKIVFNYCCFTWEKFHGQNFIKISTLQLIYYNYNLFVKWYWGFKNIDFKILHPIVNLKCFNFHKGH